MTKNCTLLSFVLFSCQFLLQPESKLRRERIFFQSPWIETISTAFPFPCKTVGIIFTNNYLHFSLKHFHSDVQEMSFPVNVLNDFYSPRRVYLTAKSCNSAQVLIKKVLTSKVVGLQRLDKLAQCRCDFVNSQRSKRRDFHFHISPY